MKIIGLTGGIGSGKSTVAQFLRESGAVIIDLDKLGHEAIKPGGEAWERIVNEFGKDILTVNGDIDRVKLGSIVFQNHEALSRLNRIVHPVIDAMLNARLEECRRQGVEVVVLEAAVIIESGRNLQVDELWVTTAPETTVIDRITERPDYTEESSRTRIRSQLTNEERIKYADIVINNDGPLDELKAKVLIEWEKFLRR